MVYNSKGQEKEKIELPDFFDVKVSGVLLHEVVVTYLNNQRAGTHETKTRGEVSFSGAKPWKQKGTGNARAGQRNSPLWRKGGIIFGPRFKSYYTKISKQKKKISMSMAFSSQFRSGNVVVVDSVEIAEIKTRIVVEIVKNLKLYGQKVVFVIDSEYAAFRIAARNLENIIVENIRNLSVYQVLWAEKIVVTSESFDFVKYNRV
ncbi:MAG: 50S ribosomal protein L4 [Elusimicrobiota bacterium]|nr:50S ribosomal protein L4 [Elusimicrobiota bacterium]